jgi:hypothetical protein
MLITIRSAHLLDTHPTHGMANLDTLIPALTRNQGSKETTSKRIASAIGINDLIIFQSGHREILWVIWLCGADQNCWLCAVCKHHDPGLGGILFVYQSDCFCDGGEVLRAREAVLVRPRFRFGLVPEEDIAVGEDFP